MVSFATSGDKPMRRWTSFLAGICCLLISTAPVHSAGQSKLDRIVEGFRVEGWSVAEALKQLRRAARLPLFYEDIEPPGTPQHRSRDWTGVLSTTKVSISLERGTVRDVLDMLNAATPITVIESDCCINVVAEGVIKSGDPLGRRAGSLHFRGELPNLVDLLKYELNLPFGYYIFRARWEGHLEVTTGPDATVRDLVNEVCLQKGVGWSMLLYHEPEELETWARADGETELRFLGRGRTLGTLYFSGAFATHRD
jgi:hypothetical protein